MGSNYYFGNIRAKEKALKLNALTIISTYSYLSLTAGHLPMHSGELFDIQRIKANN